MRKFSSASTEIVGGGKGRVGKVVRVHGNAHANAQLCLILVPLTRLPRGAASVLNPVMEIPAGEHVLLTQQMSGVPLSSLKGPAACNLAEHRDKILAAIDRVFVGI